MPVWPEWWSWDVEISPHLFQRMKDRRFNEVDLRLMLSTATGYHQGWMEGRYVVEARHDGRRWEVIVEPVLEERIVVAVTAYPVEQGDPGQ